MQLSVFLERFYFVFQSSIIVPSDFNKSIIFAVFFCLLLESGVSASFDGMSSETGVVSSGTGISSSGSMMEASLAGSEIITPLSEPTVMSASGCVSYSAFFWGTDPPSDCLRRNVTRQRDAEL